MPPLPENGPTIETAVLDLDPSPVPSANSREEETAEATEEEPQPVASKKSKRRKIRLAPSSSSSPSKDTDLKDNATSHSPPRKQASLLRVCPLSSVPPVPATRDIVFGGPSSIPSLSDDEERYVFCLSSCFLLYCLSFVEYVSIFISFAATQGMLPVLDARLLPHPLVRRPLCMRQRPHSRRPLQPLPLHPRTRLWQHPTLQRPPPVLRLGRNM